MIIKDKKMFPILLGVATIALLGVFGLILMYALWYDPESDSSLYAVAISSVLSERASKQTVATSKDPVRLLIPSLDIDAKIQAVGVNKKGNMATPRSFAQVGWYKHAATPGEIGDVIMAGHVDNGLAFPGVFKRLDNIKKGDEVEVKIQNGKSIRYVVTGIKTYAYDDKLEAISSGKGGNYLKLITCTGTWMPSKKTHDTRLVVTAIQVD